MITVRIPAVLRPCCCGAAELTFAASNLRDLLDLIERSHPSLYRSVCNETGAVRPHVNLFVNDALTSDKVQLDVALQPGDVVVFFQAVSGG